MSNYYRSNKKNHYYNQSHSSSSSSSSSSSCLGRRRRTLNTTAFPSPPPPPISSSTHKPPHFSTPRNQRFGIDNNNNNCFSDIDEWLEHANKFCKSFNHHNHHTVPEQEPEPEEEEDLTDREQRRGGLYNIVLPSVREESPLHLITSNSEELMRTLLKTYDDEFLNEIRRKKVEAEEARNKAKHLQLMHILRRKEDAINDWEFKQTTKAMDHMDKVQNELERKQIIASAKTQMKIYAVREKAEKQKLKLRRSTMKKFQQLRISDHTRNPSHSDTSSPFL